MTSHSISQIIRDRLDRAITHSLSDARKGGLKERLFCVMLNPVSWQVDYRGLSGGDHGGLSKLMVTLVRNSFVPHINDPVHKCIDDAVEQIRPVLEEYPPSDLVSAAHTVLTGRSVPMGSILVSPETPGHQQHWMLDSQARKFVFFQRVLDYASTFDYGRINIERTAADRRLVALEGRDWVLEVPHYLSGNELGVNDQSLREGLIAEYVLATNGLQVRTRAEDLHHYFIPYRGLGQWRAALCWICPEGDDITTELLIDRAYRTLSEHILGMSLVDGFMLELSAMESIDRDRDPLITGGLQKAAWAFATLWWASRIDFLRKDEHVLRLDRSANGDLITNRGGETQNPQVHDEALLTVQRDYAWHPFDTPVLLDLTSIKDESISPESARTIFGFDRVLYHVPLMTQGETRPNDDDLFMHAGELLEPRLTQFLKSAESARHRRQADRARSHANAVDTVSHSLKSAVETTGWRRALRMLDESIEGAVDAARQALMRYEIIESHAGVLRLWGICENAEYEKLRTWVDADRPTEWENSDELCFDRYVTLICRIAASICWAKQRDSGFNLTVTRHGSVCPVGFLSDPIDAGGALNIFQHNGDVQIRCGKPPGGSLLDWLRELGRIAPFSRSHTNDAHLALFSPLYEPLLNAMKHANDANDGSATISLSIEDRRPECVRVVISNNSQNKVTAPPSIKKISDVYKRTDLAEVMFSCRADADGEHLVEVDIRLTPLRLVKRILANIEGR